MLCRQRIATNAVRLATALLRQACCGANATEGDVQTRLLLPHLMKPLAIQIMAKVHSNLYSRRLGDTELGNSEGCFHPVPDPRLTLLLFQLHVRAWLRVH